MASPAPQDPEKHEEIESPVNASFLARYLDVDPRSYEVRCAAILEASADDGIELTVFDFERDADEASTLYDRRREQAYARIFELLVRRCVAALAACEHTLPTSTSASKDEETANPLASQMIRLRREDLRDGALGDHAFACIEELSYWRDRYLREQSYLVPVLIEKYLHMGVDRDDLTQEASLGLLRAIDGYDWRRGVRFSTYAKYWIQDRVLKTLYDQSRTVRLPAWIQKLWQKLHRISPRGEDGAPNPSVTPELAKSLDVSERRLRRVIDSRRAQVSLDVNMPGEDGRSFADDLADPTSLDFAMPSDAGNLGESLRSVLSTLTEREQRIVSERFGLDGQAPRSLKEIGDELGLSAERVRQVQASVLERLRGNDRIDALRNNL